MTDVMTQTLAAVSAGLVAEFAGSDPPVSVVLRRVRDIDPQHTIGLLLADFGSDQRSWESTGRSDATLRDYGYFMQVQIKASDDETGWPILRNISKTAWDVLADDQALRQTLGTISDIGPVTAERVQRWWPKTAKFDVVPSGSVFLYLSLIEFTVQTELL